jgi:tripartite-type tricarboxylate transporter receptor subunit TctC
MRANPDGYTIQIGHVGTHAASVAFYPNLAYRPDIDFEPIGLAVEQAVLIVARKDLPPNNLKEFIPYVKANFEKMNSVHGGVGSITHFTCLLLTSTLGVRPTLVPFTGSAPAMNVLIAGQVDYMCNTIPDVVEHVRSGSLKAYAISTADRNPSLPDVPTAAEAGLPSFQVSAWYAFFAPKGTPRPVLDKLSDALDRALDDEMTRKRLVEVGCDIPGKAKRGQQPLSVLVRNEIARWNPIIKAANIKMD